MKRWLKAHGLHHTLWGDHQEWEAYRAEHPPQHQQRTQQQQDRGGGPRATSRPDVDWNDLLNRHNLPRTTQPPTPAGDKASTYHPHWQPPDPHDSTPTVQTQTNTAAATTLLPVRGGGEIPPAHQAQTTTTTTATHTRRGKQQPPTDPPQRGNHHNTQSTEVGQIPSHASNTPETYPGGAGLPQPSSISLPVNKAPRFSGETWFLLEPVTARQWLLTAQQTPAGGSQEPGTLELMVGDQFILTRTSNGWSIQYMIMTPNTFTQPPPKPTATGDSHATAADQTAQAGERASSGECHWPERGDPKPSPHTRPPHGGSDGPSSGDDSPAPVRG